jgi:hypothetical protein
MRIAQNIFRGILHLYEQLLRYAGVPTCGREQSETRYREQRLDEAP